MNKLINYTATLSDVSYLVAEEMKGGIHHIIQFALSMVHEMETRLIGSFLM